MKNLGIFSIIFIICLFFFYSCDETDDENTVEIVFPDSYIRSIKIEGIANYGLAFYLESNTTLNSVVVTDPNDTTIKYELTKFWIENNENKDVQMRLLPEIEDYSSNLPTSGDYEFSTIFNSNNTLSKNDKILTSAIEVVNIDTFNFNPRLKSIYVNWNSVSNADMYVVKLSETLDGYPYFISEFLEQGPVNIHNRSRTWYTSKPRSGDTVLLSLHAYEIDHQTGNNINLGSESIDTIKFIW